MSNLPIWDGVFLKIPRPQQTRRTNEENIIDGFPEFYLCAVYVV